MKVADSTQSRPRSLSTHSVVLRITPPMQKPRTLILSCLLILRTVSMAAMAPLSM